MKFAMKLAAVMAFAWGSCLMVHSASAQAPGSDLKIALSSAPSSLDPHFAAIAPNIAMSAHFFDALVNVDPAGRFIPGLALSWTQLDATTFEFKLRAGVKFHDGSEFGAEDVVYSLDRPSRVVNSPGPFTSYTKMIASVQVVGPLVLRIKTVEPYAPLPADLSTVYIVSRKAAAQATTEDFNTGKAVVGTGPYKFASHKRGESVSMVRNHDYWGEKAAFENAMFRMITSDSARHAALLAGDVDLIENVPPADMPKLKTDPRFQVRERSSWRTLFLQLNHGAPERSPHFTDKSGNPLESNPLKDIRVRQALSKGLNRPALVQGALEGFAKPAAQIVAEGLIGFNSSLQVEPADVPAARRLLAQAGYPNGFGITLAAPNNRYIRDEEVVQTIAQLWSRIGVQVKVVTMPMATYVPKMRSGEFGAALLGWGALGGDFGLRTLLGSIDPAKGWGTWNWGRYSNPELDSAIMAAFTAPTPMRRHEAAQHAMALAMKDHAALPTHYQLASWAMRKDLDYVGRVDEFTFAHQVKMK